MDEGPNPPVESDLKKDEPVVITASVGNGYPDNPRSVPTTVDEYVDSVVNAYDAGAAIAHMHGLYAADDGYGDDTFDIAAWGEIHDRIREECDIVICLGKTTGPFEQRLEIMKSGNSKPDLVSFTPNDNDKHRYGVDAHFHRSREELVRRAELIREYDIIPEIEIFGPNSVWNVNYLIERGLFEPPYWMNLPFAMQGGVWSPAIPAELDVRRNLLPERSQWHVTHFVGSKGSDEPGHQRRFHAYAMIVGGHVRIGVEENAEYLADLPPDEATASLVNEISEVADSLGRGTATPDEARSVVGLT